MTEPLTLTKLIILYMLDSADHSLKKSQIFSFILDNDYTNYFTLMQASSEIIEAGFVEIKTSNKSAYFSITDEGRNTINSFADRISQAIKDDIFRFFKENDVEAKSSLSVSTNYYRNGHSGFIAELSAKEKNTELMHIKINMPTEEACEAMCKNFEEKCEDVYDMLAELLM